MVDLGGLLFREYACFSTWDCGMALVSPLRLVGVTVSHSSSADRLAGYPPLCKGAERERYTWQIASQIFSRTRLHGIQGDDVAHRKHNEKCPHLRLSRPL